MLMVERAAGMTFAVNTVMLRKVAGQSRSECSASTPAALDNRPLKFQEFLERVPQVVFVSATPGPFEQEAQNQVVEQNYRVTPLAFRLTTQRITAMPRLERA